MIKSAYTTLFTSAVVATTSVNIVPQIVQAETEVKFICSQGYDRDTQQRLPTTYAWTPRGKTAVVRYSTDFFTEYDPQKRCDEVSPRFHEAYHNGSLDIITNGTMNGSPVICTALESGGACETLLMTLRPRDNSLKILNHFRRLFKGEQIGPVKHSAGVPQVYYQIDIDEFLRSAPVEE